MWQADPEGVKVLDVRTPEEWVFVGHPPMATNVPLAFMAYVWDDEKKAFPWSLNPDFVELVKEQFSPDDTLLVSCRSGGRGAMAVNALAAAGFTNAYNILDGMEAAASTTPTASSTACAGGTAGRCRACPGRTTSTPSGWRSPSARPGSSTRATPRTESNEGRRGAPHRLT